MPTVVITGGPCAGKTSALAALKQRFEREGVLSVFVPEAATDLILEGIAPWTCDSMLTFQTSVMALQVKREAEALRKAEALGADALVVCDRGICDSHAYLSDEDYLQALQVNGLSEERALARYDAVFHLQSIAVTDPSSYTKSNNVARFENAEEAQAADVRTQAAWACHPNLAVIPCDADFARKVDRLAEGLHKLLHG